MFETIFMKGLTGFGTLKGAKLIQDEALTFCATKEFFYTEVQKLKNYQGLFPPSVSIVDA